MERSTPGGVVSILPRQIREDRVSIKEDLEVAFQRGLTDYLNVLNAQTLLFKQQQIEQQVQAARLSAHAELVTALGGGLGAGFDVPRDDRYVPEKPPAVMALFNH